MWGKGQSIVGSLSTIQDTRRTLYTSLFSKYWQQDEISDFALLMYDWEYEYETHSSMEIGHLKQG